jgi:trigger factor
MTQKWEKTETNVGVLEVEVSSERFTSALDTAFKKVVKQVNVPGFRKGKVPRRIFESRFGVESLYQDAVDVLLPEAYQEAVDEAGIEPVDRPSVDVIQVEVGKPFIFKATVTVKPEVQLGDYKGIEVEDKSTDVTDEDVQAELETIRASHAEIQVVEDGEVENGDTVNIDFLGTVDGEAFEGGEAENYQLEIGSGTFIPGFEDGLLGLKVGEERDITVTFPEEYHVKALAGQDAIFHVKLHDIKRKSLREIDNEFVQEISDFETVEDYVADVKAKLAERKESERKQSVENDVIREAVARAEVEIPDAMIEHEVDHQVQNFTQQLQTQNIPFDAYLEFTGMKEDEIRNQFREDAGQNVKTSLVLEAIAAAENLEVSDEDVDVELQKIADSAEMSLDRVKSMLGMRDPDFRNMKNDLRMRKTVEFLVDNSKVTPSSVK